MNNVHIFGLPYNLQKFDCFNDSYFIKLFKLSNFKWTSFVNYHTHTDLVDKRMLSLFQPTYLYVLIVYSDCHTVFWNTFL